MYQGLGSSVERSRDLRASRVAGELRGSSVNVVGWVIEEDQGLPVL